MAAALPPRVVIPEVGGEAAGRVAALAFTNGMVADLEGIRTSDLPTYTPLYESLGPDGSTTTTTAPPPPPKPRVVVTTTAATTSALEAPAQTTNSFGPCIASWYGEAFRDRPTASGELYNPDDYTAAHKTLPLGTVATVTRVDTGATVTVLINDRGPFVGDRCIDLSKAAMGALDGIGAGLITVVVSY